MSYQVLARKWRPRSFAEMAGQQHVLRALINGLDSGRLHHAYLFTGTRGVGKTTIARIFAKCLNCDQGVSSTPCGSCPTCQEIDQGRFVDLIEVDAASRTKVEDTRELLDNVQYAPTRGRYKVYLIDEVHMLSNHSFNALLKTLEEPPPHVKFLLATTDPQKVPVTILSRCLQFNLKRLPLELIRDHLQNVLGKESIDFEPEAVAQVARAADGSMRDALSLLDQAIAFGGGSVRYDEVRNMLGSIERDHLFELLQALADQDGSALMAVVARMSERAPDFADALAEMLAMLHQLALLQVVPDALDGDVIGRERLQELAERLSREDVQLFYQIALMGRRDLPLAPDPRTGFEMILLRMLAFRPADAGSGEPRPATQAAARPVPAAVAPRPSLRPSAAPAPTAVAELQPPPAPEQPTLVPPPAAEPAAPTAAARPAPADGQVDWAALLPQLGIRGMAQALAMHCEWSAMADGKVMLRLDPSYAHLRNENLEQRIEAALSKHFGTALKLVIEISAQQGHTPAELAELDRAERQRQAVESIDSDPNVAAMREAFGAEVVPGSIEPI